jgi:hypothetical protein
MSLVRLILSFALSCYSFETLALRSEIREVDSNDRLMKVVNLSMGRSTVISFQDKPVKVVSGNSNYFNVEFVGNDLTIQPLAPIETNLFVYTEKGMKFGFLLKVGPVSVYDDILYIKWKSQSEIKMSALKPQKTLQSFVLVTGGLQVNVKGFSRLGEIKSYILDLEVKNQKILRVKTGDINIFVSRGNQRFTGQKLVWEKDVIPFKKASRARLLVRVEQSGDFSLVIKADGKEVKTIITKDYL